MNLGFDTWIPVTYRDGTHHEVSLAEAFSQGREIADLAVRPHERIALMRLLVCVAQAALDGPDDEYGWADAAKDVQARVAAYLETWRSRFELFGEGPCFLQARVKSMSEFETSKLLFHRACGNNATLFDHEGGTSRTLLPAEQAIALLCFQNMSAPIGAGYTGKPPCLDRHFLQTWLVCENLLGSVLANGVDKETLAAHCPAGFGRPTWEGDLDFSDKAFLRNVTLTFLGRLAPVTRCVWLNEDGATFRMAQPGIKHPMFEEYRESAATVLAVEKKGQWERYLLGTNLNKQPWRDLQNVFRVTNGGAAARPLPLQRSEPAPYRKLWLGALVTDGKAKYEDTIEAVYDVPRELLSEDHRAVYEAGIDHANKCCFTLKKAVADYAQALKAETETTSAERHYWNSLDQRVPALFDAARALGSDEFPAKDAAWTRFCEGAACAAYEHACPSETPRQIQAFATGLKRLRFSKSKPKPKNP